jgi:Transposase domain (DUF772)
LIVGYCMGIRSERRLCEEVHLNLAYRWFCRLGLDGKPARYTLACSEEGPCHKLCYNDDSHRHRRVPIVWLGSIVIPTTQRHFLQQAATPLKKEPANLSPIVTCFRSNKSDS